MRVEIFVQARMGSTRLPGKVLVKAAGKTLLEHLCERLQRVKEADSFSILTTTNAKDDVLEEFCKKNDLSCYRGPEDDVLTRFYQVAEKRRPDAIVRITADCPLIDPQIIDQVILEYKNGSYDYVSNSLERTYPRGMDVEIFSYKTLQDTSTMAQSDEEREHVTLYMYRHPELFSLYNVSQKENSSQYRLTVDTTEDFQLIKLLLERLYPEKPNFSLQNIVDTLKRHPEWAKINAHIQQKPLKSS
ncbi:MAG: spsF [Chlamydiia bacterium]|nr:spsF [Chlamydiia bacterium]